MLTGKLGETASEATVQHVHRTLRSALNTAVRRRLIGWSPAEHIELPQYRRPKTQVWSPPDISRFLEATKDDRFGAVVRLILFTGLRRGEALGLHWTHVDLERRHLVIEWQVVNAGRGPELGAPKTRSGQRVVAIDPSTASLLQRFREEQRAERSDVGATWDPTGLVAERLVARRRRHEVYRK